MYRQIIVLMTVGAVAVGVTFAGPVDGQAYLRGESCHSGISVRYQNVVVPSITDETYTNSSGLYSFDWIVSGMYDFTYSHDEYVPEVLHDIYVPPIVTKHLPEVELAPIETGCGTAWRDYPYEPDGTEIEFPRDEGKHNPVAMYPVEWWYANFRLTGSDTETEYGAFVAFFKPGMRLFAISDLGQEQTYTRRRFGVLTAATSHLDLTFGHLGPFIACEPEEELDPCVPDRSGDVTGGRESGEEFRDELVRRGATTPAGFSFCDRWYNKKSGDDLLPFQYRLRVKDRANEDFETMLLDVDMFSLKPPMIVGGDGRVDIGDGWSYYYSHTKVQVSGTIQVHGRSEPVTGYAWIDHQWGDFLLGEDVRWEWFSIQLEDYGEIMVADVWVDGQLQGSLCDGLNLYDDSCNFELLDQDSISQQDFWYDTGSGKVFATQWLITEPSKPISLTVTAAYEEQAMELGNPELFPIHFWEGLCWVEGTIGGASVSGKAYVESTHSWESSPDSPTSPPPSGDLSLSQRGSNPFNPATTIRYALAQPGQVKIDVYNVLGQQVITLVNDFRPAGSYSVNWNASDVPSGTYFIQMRAGGDTRAIKVLLVK